MSAAQRGRRNMSGRLTAWSATRRRSPVCSDCPRRCRRRPGAWLGTGSCSATTRRPTARRAETPHDVLDVENVNQKGGIDMHQPIISRNDFELLKLLPADRNLRDKLATAGVVPAQRMPVDVVTM